MTDDAPRPVLLTVSGRIPDGLTEAVATGTRPRVDYVALAEELDAELIARPEPTARGRFGRLAVRLVGEDVAMAVACWRRRREHDVILTDGEQVGLPLAALLGLSRAGRRARGPRHIMIVHIISVPKKSRLFRVLRLGRGIDATIVYASAQRDHLTGELGMAASQVHLLPFMVDTEFFHPGSGADGDGRRQLVVTAGLECRDYPTLLEAARGLDADVVIGAASFWSKRGSGIGDTALPPNVRVDSFSLSELRDLYERATVVAMPLQPVEFQAGITTILEAMAMARAVVCTRTPGQTDTIIDGETGVYVPPGQPTALRDSLAALLADPAERDRLGQAGRAWAVAHADIERYVANIGAVVDSVRTTAAATA